MGKPPGMAQHIYCVRHRPPYRMLCDSIRQRHILSSVDLPQRYYIFTPVPCIADRARHRTLAPKIRKQRESSTRTKLAVGLRKPTF